MNRECAFCGARPERDRAVVLDGTWREAEDRREQDHRRRLPLIVWCDDICRTASATKLLKRISYVLAGTLPPSLAKAPPDIDADRKFA